MARALRIPMVCCMCLMEREGPIKQYPEPRCKKASCLQRSLDLKEKKHVTKHLREGDYRVV